MKAFDKHFPAALFIMLHKVVLTFESVDEILKCYRYCAILSSEAVHYAMQGGSNF